MADTFRTGRTRRLTLTWDFQVNGLYRAIIPRGEGFRGVTGFNVLWLGFEVWGGSVAAACQSARLSASVAYRRILSMPD